MEIKAINRENWVSSFTLVGAAKVNEFTFKINNSSEKSKYIYNSMNIGIDCGEKHGVVYGEMMGGYSQDKQNIIYAHCKDENGRDDYKTKIEVDWNDRFDESVIEKIGDNCFFTVGLEKTTAGKTYYKRFLSAYDAIAYVNEHLTDGMIVNVKGNLKYSLYNDKVQVRKQITSIVLSKAESADKYFANFTQTVLLNADSTALTKDFIDKDKGVLYINARILDYMKEVNGHEYRTNYPYNKTFEFAMDFANQSVCKTIVDKLFKIRKGVTQITFDGEFVEGGAVVTATLDDIPQEIKDLINCGIYTEEEALARCSTNGSREQRMILKKPVVRMTGDDENKVPVLQKFEEKYTEDELDVSYLFADDEDVAEEIESEETDSMNEAESENPEGELDWLNAL